MAGLSLSSAARCLFSLLYNFAQNISDIMSHLRDVLAIYDRTNTQRQRERERGGKGLAGI